VQNDERYHLFVELHHFRHDWQPEGPPFWTPGTGTGTGTSTGTGKNKHEAKTLTARQCAQGRLLRCKTPARDTRSSGLNLNRRSY
jgi:hypothetical protein